MNSWLQDLFQAAYQACLTTQDGLSADVNVLLSNASSIVAPHLAEKLWCPLFFLPGSQQARNPSRCGSADRLVKKLVNEWRHDTLHMIPCSTGDFSGVQLAQKRHVPCLHEDNPTALEGFPLEHSLCHLCEELGLGSQGAAAVTVCMDCKLKLCATHDRTVHCELSNMDLHRRHRNRVVHWNCEHGGLEQRAIAVNEGLHNMASVWSDGVTGLVKEPVRHVKRHGVLGAVSGTWSGVINLATCAVTGPLKLAQSTVQGIVNVPHEDLPFGSIDLAHAPMETDPHSSLAAYASLLRLNTATRPNMVNKFTTKVVTSFPGRVE
jgi:hypothetical protein